MPRHGRARPSWGETSRHFLKFTKLQTTEKSGELLGSFIQYFMHLHFITAICLTSEEGQRGKGRVSTSYDKRMASLQHFLGKTRIFINRYRQLADREILFLSTLRYSVRFSSKQKVQHGVLIALT